MHIDVVSDFVCPWCFIGVRRLSAMLALAAEAPPGAAPAVRWHPFLLNPQTPSQGEPYLPFMLAKFGSPAAVDALHARVSAAAAPDGIAFEFARMRVRPSTLAAHALVSALQGRGVAVGALVTGLFEAHFLHGQNIGQAAVLRRLAAEAGVSERDFSAASAAAPDARELTRFARQLGVGGVPLFVFDARLAVSGAQPVDALAAAMRRAAAEA